MSLSFEKRHLPDILAFHKQGIGGGGMFVVIQDFLLLESDPGTATDLLLLESDTGAGTDGLELESSNV